MMARPAQTETSHPLRTGVARTLQDLVLVRDTDHPALILGIWIALGAASIMLAIAVTLRGESLQDLWMVRDWLHHWRARGDPYPVFHQLDYPPNALLVLLPLGMLSDAVVPSVLLLTMLPVTVAAILILVRWFAAQLAITLTRSEQAALAVMVLAGAAMRTTIWRGQSAPLAILFGALALQWCRQRPIVATIALALCAFKPHVAIGFGIAIAILEGPMLVAAAVAIVFAQCVIFAATVGSPVMTMLDTYANNLFGLYVGPDAINGLTSVNWVIGDVAGPFASTPLVVAIALAALACIAPIAKRRLDAVASTFIVALCLLWSLLFLPHQIYHAMLSVPALWLVMWPEAGGSQSRTVRAAMVGVFLLISVVDVPRVILYAALHFDNDRLAYASYYLRPIAIAALFVVTLKTANRQVATLGGDLSRG